MAKVQRRNGGKATQMKVRIGSKCSKIGNSKETGGKGGETKAKCKARNRPC